jgi:putative transposase
MRFRFVARERASFPVRMLCRVVAVSASGFYAWPRRGPARREDADRGLRARVGAIFAASRGTYGSPRGHRQVDAGGGKEAP